MSQPVNQADNRVHLKLKYLILNWSVFFPPFRSLNERSGAAVGGQMSTAKPLSIVTLFPSKRRPLPSSAVAPTWQHNTALIKSCIFLCKVSLCWGEWNESGPFTWDVIEPFKKESLSVVYISWTIWIKPDTRKIFLYLTYTHRTGHRK